MWIRNKRRSNSPAGCLLLPSLLTLLLLLLLMVCLGDALKSGEHFELPTVSPVLNVVENAGSDVSSDFERLIEAKLNESASATRHSEELLSRKRRYLVFPEGSSFQMVFDEIICVVDYTNYLVLGITVALAWELPSKPPSEALEDLLTKLDDGTLDISRNDTVSNITYVDNAVNQTTETNNNNYKINYINLSNGGGAGAAGGGSNSYNSYYSSSPIFRTPMHPSHQYVDSYYKRTNAPARRKDNFYYTNNRRPMGSSRNPFENWSQAYSPAQNTRYPYWALASHLKDTLRQRNNFYSSGNNRRQSNIYYGPPKEKRKPKIPRIHHQIYPVFGKRSIPDADNPHHRQRRSGISSTHDNNLTRMESHQIKYHRNSRQTLYQRIEKYLNKRGQNGHQCVLRTLCETGQKSGEKEPGSFVGELLRAVFTIPEGLDQDPDTHYDKAHAHNGDCAALYPECQQSIWDAPFIQ